ncbi:hypothetical protein BpHYR1_023894 [Brachionus plicatilis]|uniref:Uncharacterized protein n=1 Tax=Brachionus plicatilis TaxID=10195 RepID=A0A3M7RL29_BRAPC|nr:hypothetical protein BpHYR1_023894 [Brachionus plicatilis]
MNLKRERTNDCHLKKGKKPKLLSSQKNIVLVLNHLTYLINIRFIKNCMNNDTAVRLYGIIIMDFQINIFFLIQSVANLTSSCRPII